ncbi:MAG: TlpA family protein disulfide reductase [Syntrophomonadaceae bacterium]|jgi:thiol-disulfide isomerase/thioredoxin|nr:TlpA family protein disulfide reductase [Syntrophomonadaceae bacterium]
MRRLFILAVVLLMLLSGCSRGEQPGSTAANNPANPLAGRVVPSFSAYVLNGQVVTEQVFRKHNLTMINIWGTYCQPCIREMPELDGLQKKYEKSGVKILGVVVDRNAQAARRIVSQTGAAYQNIIPDASLENSICRAFNYVPVSIFVDSSGRILGEIVSGANNLEGYSKVIDRLLESESSAAADDGDRGTVVWSAL